MAYVINIWGFYMWLVRNTLIIVLAMLVSTTAFALELGDVVTNQSSNLKIRSQPSTSGSYNSSENLMGGEVGLVIDGSVSAAGYTWWKIKWSHATGWSADIPSTPFQAVRPIANDALLIEPGTSNSPGNSLSSTSQRFSWGASKSSKVKFTLQDLTTGSYVKQNYEHIPPNLTWQSISANDKAPMFLDISGLVKGHKYRWWLWLCSSAGCASDYTSVKYFTIKADKLPPAKPVLKSPSNNATVSDTTPKLRWYSADRAASYTLQVIDTTDNNNQVYYQRNITRTYVTIDELTPGHDYSWTVIAVDSDGESSETSDVWAFSEEALPKPVVTSISPNQIIGSMDRQPLTLTGTDFQSGLNVFLFYKDTADGTWKGVTLPSEYIHYNTNQSDQIIIDVLTQYEDADWAVSVRNPDGQVSDFYQFHVSSPAPLAINSITPDLADVSQSPITMTIRGDGFTSTSKVYWKVSGSSAYQKMQNDPEIISPQEMRITFNLGATPDTWTIQIRDENRVVNFSNEKQFVITNNTESLILNIPSASCQGDLPRVELNWNNLNNTDNYIVYRAHSNTTKLLSVELDKTTLIDTDNLIEGSMYGYKVLSNLTSGEQVWSNNETVTIPQCSIANPIIIEDVTVTEPIAQVGATFSIKAVLSESLPQGYKASYIIVNEGKELIRADFNCNQTRVCQDSVIVNKSGQNYVWVSVYDDTGKKLSGYPGQSFKTKPSDQIATAPVLISSDITTTHGQRRLVSGEKMHIESHWQLTPDQAITKVNFKYRRLNTSDWSTQELTLVKATTEGTRFIGDLRIVGLDGSYQYQLIATDNYHQQSSLNAGIGDKIFTIFTNTKPKVTYLKDFPERSYAVGTTIQVKVRLTDKESNLDYVRIYWAKGANAPTKRTEISGGNTAATFTKAFNTPGDYTISTYVVDEYGEQSYKTRTIHIYRPIVYSQNSNTGRGNQKTGITPNGKGVIDPIDTASGAQFFNLPLLSVKGLNTVQFSPSYNSLQLTNGSMGKGWSHQFGLAARLEFEDAGIVTIHWSNGAYNSFKSDGAGNYTPLSEHTRIAYDQLTKQVDSEGVVSFKLARANKETYHFTSTGILLKVENNKGQHLDINFNDQGLVDKIIDPVSGVFISYHYDVNNLLTQVSDIVGRTINLEYSSERQLIKITDAEGYQHTFTYNEFGQIKSRINNDSILYFSNTFDEKGRVVAQEDGRADNAQGQFTYQEDEATGTITTTYTSRGGNTKTYVNNSDYKLLSETDGLGNTTTHTYNKGQLTSTTNALGRITQMEYDANGNLTKITYPKRTGEAQAAFKQFTYDTRRNITEIIEPLGKRTTFTYDANNNRLTATTYNGSTALTTRYEYNADGQLIKETTPEGNITQYSYYNGRLVKTIDAEDNTTQFEYDLAGRLIKTIYPDGYTVSLVLDNKDRIRRKTDSAGRSWTYEYDSRDKVVAKTDAKGNTTRFSYDGNGNLISKTDALNNVSRYQYDAEDRLIKTTDANGNSTQIEYDAAGRIVKTTNALGNSRHMQYDAVGNLIKTIDAQGNTESLFEYDERDQLIKVTDSLGNVKSTLHDVLGRPVSKQDGKNQQTRFEYNTLDQLIKVIDAKSGNATQEFNQDGIRTAFTDPNQNKTQLIRNKNAQIIKEITASGSTSQTTYNARSLIATTTNGRNQTRTYTYDTVGRVKSIADPDGTISYTYDKNNNVLTVTENGKTITRTYDALNRILSYSSTFNGTAYTIAYGYDAVGNLTSLTYPDGKVVSYTYDANNRLLSVKDWNNKITAYEYDKNGRMIKTTRPNGTVLTRSYNAAGQLTQQKDVTATGTVISQYDYSYDAAGNIVTETMQPEPDPKTMMDLAMTYAAGNQLKTVDQQQTVFDADDNMTALPSKSGTINLQYDSRNRLKKAGETSSVYDAENHRVAMVNPQGQTHFIVNPEAPLSQALVMQKPQAQATIFAYGRGLVSQEQNGQTLYYHYDLRGSTVALTNQNGDIVDRFEYLPYGELMAHSVGSTETPFLYNGRDGVMDDGNGFYYMRARFYSTEVKRFVSRDLFLGIIGKPQSKNRYIYVLGGNQKYIDPTGYSPNSGDSFNTISHSNHGISLKISKEKILNDGTKAILGGAVDKINSASQGDGRRFNGSHKQKNLKGNIRLLNQQVHKTVNSSKNLKGAVKLAAKADPYLTMAEITVDVVVNQPNRTERAQQYLDDADNLVDYLQFPFRGTCSQILEPTLHAVPFVDLDMDCMAH